VPGTLRGDERVVGHEPHAEREGALGDERTDAPEPDDATCTVPRPATALSSSVFEPTLGGAEQAFPRLRNPAMMSSPAAS